jgi:glutamine synthetase
MKDWAIKKGALYFSHVFYPLTGLSAEKHDGFIMPDSDGAAITEFTGSLLVKGEPDGSSFPNGGIRGTFEARGYTAWDVTSPAYIMNTDNGKTLMSADGVHLLDRRGAGQEDPLLRSNAAMDKAARRVLSLLGETDIAPVNSSCGAEQEYFLVDTNFAVQRPDLLLAGRTLFGKPPAKGQEFDDHYFGAIPERVQVFMQDVEEQALQAQHPGQDPPQRGGARAVRDRTLFRDRQCRRGSSATADDHPQGDGEAAWPDLSAAREALRRHQRLRQARQLVHRQRHPGQPAGPGQDTPREHPVPAVLRRRDSRRAQVRAAAARGHRIRRQRPSSRRQRGASGDHVGLSGQPARGRLRADQQGCADRLERRRHHECRLCRPSPTFNKDAGDRNRTSPFAFTGNRFEFRAVGSNQSVAGPLIAMNTMLADSLNWIADKLEAEISAVPR